MRSPPIFEWLYFYGNMSSYVLECFSDQFSDQTSIPDVSIRNSALYSCTKKRSPLSHCSNELIPTSVFLEVLIQRGEKRSLTFSKWSLHAGVRIREIWGALSDKATCSHKAAHAGTACRELFSSVGGDPMLLLHVLQLMSHWENNVEIILPSHTGRTKLMEWKGQCTGQRRRLSTHLNTRVSRQAHMMLFGQLVFPTM